MPHPNYPILVGFGQIVQKTDDPRRALEPASLMAEAARRAAADSGADLLPKVDSVRVVNLISWSYGDAPAALADTLGITPRERVYTSIGGNSPQYLINQTADDIARGKVGIALLAGAEAFYTQRLARSRKLNLPWKRASGAPDRTIGDDRWGTQDVETRHGAAMPIHIYPMFENALRKAGGLSIEEHRQLLGRVCARFSEIAARNPYAWFREPKTAREITTITPENRMICFPYAKFMNSILDVDQGAAAIMTSVATARELGIPEERWIHVLGAADAHDHWYFLDRVDYTSSPAIRRAGRAALEQASSGAGEIEFLDLYSCFPCAPRIARDMLGIAEDDPRDLTTTGSLLYFGGPGSNHPLHAVAAVAEKLRANPGSKGLVTGLGWYLTKHSVGVYSTAGTERPWKREDPRSIQREIDSEPHPASALEPGGSGTIETYTVVHGRDGAPSGGIVIGRLEDQRRFIANTPPDRSLLEDMERREMIGERGRVRAGEADGANLWQPA